MLPPDSATTNRSFVQAFAMVATYCAICFFKASPSAMVTATAPGSVVPGRLRFATLGIFCVLARRWRTDGSCGYGCAICWQPCASAVSFRAVAAILRLSQRGAEMGGWLQWWLRASLWPQRWRIEGA